MTPYETKLADLWLASVGDIPGDTASVASYLTPYLDVLWPLANAQAQSVWKGDNPVTEATDAVYVDLLEAAFTVRCLKALLGPERLRYSYSEKDRRVDLAQVMKNTQAMLTVAQADFEARAIQLQGRSGPAVGVMDAVAPIESPAGALDANSLVYSGTPDPVLTTSGGLW